MERATEPTLAQLAELLRKDFTVYNFDRRGRGESTDNSDVKSFTKEREIEDIQALVGQASKHKENHYEKSSCLAVHLP